MFEIGAELRGQGPTAARLRDPSGSPWCSRFVSVSKTLPQTRTNEGVLLMFFTQSVDAQDENLNALQLLHGK